MAVQYCNYDIKGTLAVTGDATMGGALNVTEYIFRTGQGSNYHRFLNARQIFVVGNASSIDLNNGVSTFGATGGATTLRGTSVTLDSSADITLDAAGSDINLKVDGTNFGRFTKNGNDFHITATREDGDIKFFGSDGGTSITSLRLDMSDNGWAYFNSGIQIEAGLYIPSYIYHNGDTGTYFGFEGNDSWRVVTNSSERISVNNSGLRIGNGARVTTTLDEDNMASNSATALATQQSIKAYVDTSVSGAGSGTFLPLAGGTMTGNVRLNDNVQLQLGSSNDAYIMHNGTHTYFVNGVGNLEITNDTNDGDILFKCDDGSGGVTQYFRLDGGAAITVVSKDFKFSDNVKARFGTSDDLQIYHDGGNSYINEVGTGDLIIKGGNDILFLDAAGNTLANMNQANSVELYYGNSKKFETTSAGITITGGIITQGIQATSNLTTPTIQLQGDLNVLNKAQTSYLTLADRDVSGSEVVYNLANVGSATFAGNVAINGATGITGLNGITFQNGIILDDSIGAEYLKFKYNGANAGGIQIFDNQNTLQGYLYATGAATSEFGLLTGAGQWGVRTKENAEVGLYYNNSQKLQTTSGGVTVTGGMSVGAINTTGTLDISSSYPRINLNDTTNEDDWSIINDDGSFTIYNVDDNVHALKINGSNDITISNDLTVSGGDIILSGATGRIQGIDTVTSGTDAANKTYVDTQIQTIPSGLNFQGNWNASTNSPTLASGTGTPGFYYNVSVAGTTDLDGETDWQVGDWAVFVENGTNDFWEKIDNTSALTGVGVSGRVTFWDGTNTLSSDSGLTYDSSANNLTVGTNVTAGNNIVAGGTVQAAQGYSYQWAEAYNNQVTAISDSGSSTITLTLTQQDGGTLTTSFSNPQGTVTGVGAANRIAYWANSTMLQSNAGFTFNGTDFATPGGITTGASSSFAGNISVADDINITNAGGVVSFTGSGYIGAADNFYVGGASNGTDHTYIGDNGRNVTIYNGATLTISGALNLQTLSNATTDTNKFLVADGSEVKYRTGSQLLSDIGGAPATGGAYLPLAGGTLTGALAGTSATFAGNLTLSSASSPTLTITDTSQTTTLLAFAQNSNAHIGTFSSHPFIIDTNSTAALTIDTSQNATFAGDVTINSAGDATSPTLRLNNSSSGSFNHALEAINANLTAGETELLLFGKETNTRNSGFIGFNWNADDSDTNYVTIGHWGYNHLVKIFPTGDTIFTGDLVIDDGVGRITLSSVSGENRIQSTTTGFAAYEKLAFTADDYEFKLGNATFAGSVTTPSVITPLITTATNTSLFLQPNGSGHLYLGDSTNGTNLYHYSASNDGVYTTYDFNGNYYRISTTATSGVKIDDPLTVSADIILVGTGRIQGVDTVSVGTDAANKDYVDTAVAGSGSGSVTGVSSSTTSQLTVSESSPAPALSIVTAAVANGGTGLATGNQIYDWGVAAFAPIVSGGYLPLAGGTMTGDIQFNEHSAKFNESGVRSWDISAFSGNLNITSGDSTGTVFLSPALSVEDNATIGGSLDVNGAVSTFGAAGTGTGDAVVSIDGGSGTGGEAYLRLTRGSTSGFILNHTASALQVRATANIPMLFYTNDTLALTLSTSQHATFAGDLYIPEYIYHSGDTNTYIRFTADTQTFRTGGDDRLTLTNSAATFANDITLGPSSSIVLDDTPTASTASGSGTIVNWSVSESTTAGTLYVVKTNGGWTTADADSEAKSTAMAAIALGSNATAGMLLQGFFYKSSHGFAIGSPLYISNTAGAFSNTRPTGTGDYVRIIGYATSTNYIYFDPDKTWVKID